MKINRVDKSARCGQVALIAIGCLTAPFAASAQVIFFGEDVNAGASLPVPISIAAQTSFLANLVGVRVENFEGIPVNTTFPFNIAFAPDTATLTGTNNVGNTGIANTGIGGRFAVSGSRYLNVGTTDANSFRMTFSSPQAALGFFATDIGDISGQLALSFDGRPGLIVPHTLGAPNGAGLFYGIIDVNNPFTSVTFTNTNGSLNDAFGFDDFTIGRIDQVAMTPEPSALVLFSTGALSLFAFTRRRKNRV